MSQPQPPAVASLLSVAGVAVGVLVAVAAWAPAGSQARYRAGPQPRVATHGPSLAPLHIGGHAHASIARALPGFPRASQPRPPARSLGRPAAPAQPLPALLAPLLLLLSGGLWWATRRAAPSAMASVTATPPTPAAGPGPQPSALEEYVRGRGGSLPIRKVLIANNGMAATKFIHSVRTWAYFQLGDDKAIEFVAMASPEDLRANAKFLSLADSVVEVPGGVNRNNYANVDLIIRIAVQQGVDAVWPGWGHASENPALPNGLKARGIKFIGPPGPVMAALGDKIAANLLAQTAKVPCIPWSGDGLTVPPDAAGAIPKELFAAACITSKEQALEVAERIGYPVMLKASEGGGGKGIRMAQGPEETANFYEQVCNEVVGSPVFMMQLCAQARHIEIQIVGDEHGNAVALNGRDCSTQRRFQKIFEEGPPTITPPDVFRQMELSALRLTQSIGYVGAGTVEYLYQPSTNQYYFLELNPRLQVEHPVTESLTGVNLPATQLQVAMGIPLNAIPQVRSFYGLPDPYGHSKIRFAEDPYRPLTTHVIAARITAENPDEGFKPTSGSIRDIRFRSTPNVWGYFSIGGNGGIHEFADSQFGHLFASGADREEARKHLVLALKEMEVRGEIRTPVAYLVHLLETEAFRNNTLDTSWLDGLLREKKGGPMQDRQEVVLAAAIYRASEHIAAVERGLAEALQRGQLAMAGLRSALAFPVEVTYLGRRYTFDVARTSETSLLLTLNGQAIPVAVRLQADGSLLCTYGGGMRFVSGMEEPLGLRVVINGVTHMIPNVVDPSELRSDVNGRLVRYLQKDGGKVEQGRPYAEVEAMKMIMTLSATETGNITHLLTPGSIISPGDQLASLQLLDPSRAAKIRPYTRKLVLPPEEEGPPADPYETLRLALAGFNHPDVEAAVQAFMAQAGTPAEQVARIEGLLQQYWAVEQHFAGRSMDAAVLALVQAHKDAVREVLRLVMAHLQLRRRNTLVCSLLRQASTLPFAALRPVLTDLATLRSPAYGEVALAAVQMLDVAEEVPFEVRAGEVRRLAQEQSAERVAVSPWLYIGVDHLAALFGDPDPAIARTAVEAYVRKVLYPHAILTLMLGEAGGVVTAAWEAKLQHVPPSETPVRCGHLALFPAWESTALAAQLKAGLAALQLQTATHPTSPLPIHDLHLVFAQCPALDEETTATALQPLITAMADDLRAALVGHVYVLLPQTPARPLFFSYPAEDGYQERLLSRTTHPGVSALLELPRLLGNYSLQLLPSIRQYARLYLGVEKSEGIRPNAPQTIFLRTVSFRSAISKGYAERHLLAGLDELERCMLDPRVAPTASARMFLAVPTPLTLTRAEALKTFTLIMDALIARHAPRLLQLRVDEIEIAVRIPEPDGSCQPIRLIASSINGEWLRLDSWREYPNPVTGVTERFCTIAGNEEDQLCRFDPYPATSKIGLKRVAARRIGSTYAYDFLGLLNQELIRLWGRHLDDMGAEGEAPPVMPQKLFEAQSLQWRDGALCPSESNVAGSNTIGMLAWLCRLKTPEYPAGRDVVLIANDVTVENGSFGVKEDEFFHSASVYARRLGLPRVYISCNSGARIGLVEELKPQFEVAFKDPQNPTLGYDYLYLRPQDHEALPAGSVQGEMVFAEDGERRFKLSDIIGQQHGIGVENLQGSGLIAGETSRAYQDTFTLSYVTGRSVGIGAYLVRLGQRVIQNQTAPIILTGHQALNSVLGREVYTGMEQLGGPQIMFNNGVSHQVVATDQEGVEAILRWLSYVPRDKFAPPPRLPTLDPVERAVEFVPTRATYDPRHMLAGALTPDGTWVSGFFDRGSFTETMASWGKSVVAGRARLGGLPFGVIAVETRMVEQRIPADPANPDSREAILPQAGQVWFPDSAFKTAQAINDFNRGENLPLMVFANWRGFSGGTRDMYGEILKFGAMIVDALVGYRHPVFVYIPPFAELRGGAWVVIDPSINPEQMEMYADPESRGGILEPAGIAAIKFRQADQTQKMHQLDPQLQEWDETLRTATAEELPALQQKVRAREVMLMPLYLQIAQEFADLHDRCGRMKAKGVIRDVVPWAHAREYFYWRATRRLKEGEVVRRLQRADPALTLAQARGALQAHIPDYASDQKFLQYIEAHPGAVEGWAADARRGAARRALDDVLATVSAEELRASLAKLEEP